MKRNSLFLALAQAAAFSSYAATISVTTTDESNAVQCTLRDAVFSANQDTSTGGCVAGNGADIIQFAVPTPATISFSQTGIPSIYAPLDVQGPGSDLLTIQGSGFGIFGTAGNTYSISGISVGGSGFVALRVEDTTVSVDDVVVSGVTTTSSVSAIHAENATVTISNSTISDNSTGGQASGIQVLNGSLTVSDSTISRNTSDISTGAIRILDTSARVYRTEFVENSGSHAAILSIGVTDLLIDDSVFHGNYSLEASVGISTYPAGSVTISNTTFGNGLGKALSAYRAEVDLHDVSISNYDHSIFSGTVFVNHSTLYANSLSVVGTSNGIGALIQSTPSEVRNSTLTHNVVGMELNGNSSFYGRNIRISDSLSSGVEVFGSGGDSPTLSFHLVDSEISNNRTDGIDDLEAGLSISGADFYLDSVSVSGNSSGGGIKVFGSGNGRLVDVSVVGNTGYLGGGVSVKDSGTILEIDNSTISGNTATRGGGLSAQSGSQITIVNSTISENTGVVAGAIYSQASVSLIHSTLTGNHDDGSGSVATSAQGLVSVTNSILASGENSAACGNQSDIRPYGTNDFQDASCNGIDSGDPMLTEVADNGGPTPTQHPRAGSPVIDTADSAFCPPFDQRGEMRGATPCDLGAVEVVDINQPPRIDDQSFVINTGFMVDDPVGILAFSDPEMLLGADPLTIIGPDQGFRVESDGMVLVDSTIVPGVATLAVEVTDPGGLSDRAAVVIDVIELPLFIDGFEQ